MKDDLIRVSLIKRDAAGNALAGAEFAVQGRFPDGDAEKTFSSDDTGVLFQDYVLLGSEDGERYLIRETQAPAGYELLGDVVLRVHDDGTVVVDDETPEGVRDAVSIDQVGGTAVVTVEDAAIEVGLRRCPRTARRLPVPSSR